MGPGPQPSLVVLVQELRLVRRHVDVDRALALARLARQTQVERLADLFRTPGVRQGLAAQHLAQHPGAAPGGVHLVTGGLERRAHRAGGVAAAADADAVGGEREQRQGVPVVAGPGPHGGVQWGGVDQDARVEQPLRVPDVLELPEGADEFG